MYSAIFRLVLPALAAGAYNETLAIQYANLAGAAYCAPKDIASWTCGDKCIKGVDSVQTCQGSSTIAFVGKWGGTCLASFEGTNGVASASVDMDTQLAPFLAGGSKAHRGFLKEWGSLKTCIKDSLLAIRCGPTAPLRATGHSLGAAVAALAMMDLKEAGWNVVEIYNFGMPRAGDAAFARSFDAAFKGQFFRVTHGKDPFVDMPPDDSFVHVEPEVFYKGAVQDGYVICNTPTDRKCAAQYFPDWSGVWDSSKTAYHHDYMGVDTTQAGCASPTAACGADIAESWCMGAMIPCNEDVRCDYHKYPSMVQMGYKKKVNPCVFCAPTGKCRCKPNLCQVNGKCAPKEEVEESEEAEELPVPERMTERSPGITGALQVSAPPLFLLACGLVGSAAAIRVFRRTTFLPVLRRQLIAQGDVSSAHSGTVA